MNKYYLYLYKPKYRTQILSYFQIEQCSILFINLYNRCLYFRHVSIHPKIYVNIIYVNIKSRHES